jgi:hypothetical protein
MRKLLFVVLFVLRKINLTQKRAFFYALKKVSQANYTFTPKNAIQPYLLSIFEGILKKIIISYLSREEESCKKSA